ncbi:MAG: hypothetical protein JJ975_17555 [Bacteroidia bacterium]|nr:hypothetical protein [Bacteroidia bacterium]
MDVLLDIYHKSQSKQDFYRRLEHIGMKLVYKQGRVVGFRDHGNRRFDLTKLGYPEFKLDMLQQRTLGRMEERLKRLEQAPKLGLEMKKPKR